MKNFNLDEMEIDYNFYEVQYSAKPKGRLGFDLN